MAENQKHCYIEDSIEPAVTCNCERKPALIWENYEINYCDLKDSKHYLEINEESRTEVLKKFYKVKSDIKLCKSKIIQEEYSLISEIQKATQKALIDLKIQEQKINEYILKALSLTEIGHTKKVSFVESLLKYSPNDLAKAEFIKPVKLNIKSIHPWTVWKLFHIEEISEQSINLVESPSQLKYIWDFSCTDLRVFDPETSNLENMCLQLPEGQKIGQQGAKCLLPDGSLFYEYGPITIIIDPNYHIKTLPKYSQQSGNACAVYKDREIYLFGGAYTHSVKFSLSKNRWTRLLNMPISLGSYTFGTVFKNYILLGSMHSDKILYYDTEIDSYSEISSLNLEKLAKAFFVENETVYLIEFSKYIYMSTDYLMTWVNIGSSSILAGNRPIFSTPITYYHKVYFANYSTIYSFDLRQKEIEKVKASIEHEKNSY